MKRFLLWLSDTVLAASWIYLLAKFGWKGLVTGFVIFISSVTAYACKERSLRKKEEKENEQHETDVQ